MNRQESHRIYLQSFVPRSAQTKPSGSGDATLHRHDSHDIHPPEYPTTSSTNPFHYNYNSSSESSVSSYSFSSSFSSSHSNTASRRNKPIKKVIATPSAKSTNVATAIVRLTDKARTKDVTPLLRNKFGLPPMADDEVDTLVLVGICERPPKGYIRFEHESFLDEQRRVEKIRRHLFLMERQPCPGQERLATVEDGNTRVLHRIPISESTATVKASGAKPGWTSSMLLVSEDTPLRTSVSELSNVLHSSSSGSSKMMNPKSNSAIGLDLSSSRSSSVFGSSTGGGGGGEKVSSWVPIGTGERTMQDGEYLDFSSPTISTQESPRSFYEYDSEPVNIIRTLLPEEHLLQVRDEMLVKLMQMRERAENEMGFHLINDETEDVELFRPASTIQWYFQPCSPLGCTVGLSASVPKIQSIPAYIEVEGYCTGDDSESDQDENLDLDITERTRNDDDQKNFLPEPQLSDQMSKFIEERQRIHALRELSDPLFILSGYLLKQSRRDPFIWRRVYCVLSEDRLWTIRRMRLLKKCGVFSDSDGILSTVRVGRNQFITLYRSLLLEKEDISGLAVQDSPSTCSGYYVPLNHRLRNAFRLITARGQSHTFRALNSQSLRLWVTSLSERIAQMHGDGLMDLANVIAEEEALARCRRIHRLAVFPLEAHCNLISEVSIDIVRYGIAVASFKERCQQVHETIHLCNNVHESPPVDMVPMAWENARVVATKSAQLLHTLGALHRKGAISNLVMGNLVEEHKSIQLLLAKYWEDLQNRTLDRLFIPPLHLFDQFLKTLQMCITQDN